VVGEIRLYFYIPKFPWRDFLMRRIQKVQKHKEESHRSGKFKKTRRKDWRKEKEEIFTYLEVPSVFSIGWERPQLLSLCDLPQENPLIWEPPLQHL
jgi:hypothetical protein